MSESLTKKAVVDIRESFRKYPLIGMLAWQDVKMRYRRSLIGPFWITISMGVVIGVIGYVFGQIFKSPMSDYLPFLTVGMIVWGLISSVITDGCVGFISAEGIIKQLSLPLFVHILRPTYRNLVIMVHNLVIVPLVFLFFGKLPSAIALLGIPGLLLILLNLSWMALLLGMLCTRYRDLPQIVTNFIQIIYFLTPIMWMPGSLDIQSARYLLDYNPAYHLIELVRAPLLGTPPTVANWSVALAMAGIGWAGTILAYGQYKKRIAYWL